MCRLRALPDLATTYTEPHDHRRFGHGHHLRVKQTIAVAKWLHEWGGCGSVADLSCGNGHVAIAAATSGDRVYLGDYAPGYEFRGPIEQTHAELWEATDHKGVDLFVCCETLEHLDDPDLVLRQLRRISRYLVLSTPVDNWDDANGEHLWAWDRVGVEDLFKAAGWQELHYTESDTRPIDGVYQYGIWALEAA